MLAVGTKGVVDRLIYETELLLAVELTGRTVTSVGEHAVTAHCHDELSVRGYSARVHGRRDVGVCPGFLFDVGQARGKYRPRLQEQDDGRQYRAQELEACAFMSGHHAEMSANGLSSN